MENEKITIKVGYLPSIEADICEQKTYVYDIPENRLLTTLIRNVYIDILSYMNWIYETNKPNIDVAYYCVITIFPDFDCQRYAGGERFCEYLKAYLEFEGFHLPVLVAIAER